VLVALLLVPLAVCAQPSRLERMLASLPDGAFATHAWYAERAGQGFVYLLEMTGQPHGTVYQPFVRDLGLLERAELARALQPVVNEAAANNVVVDAIRNSTGSIVAYVVRHRDVQVNPAFARDGHYTLYVRVGDSTESGGAGGAGGGM